MLQKSNPKIHDYTITKLDTLDVIILYSTFIKIYIYIYIYFLAEIIKKFSAITMTLDTIFLREFFHKCFHFGNVNFPLNQWFTGYFYLCIWHVPKL